MRWLAVMLLAGTAQAQEIYESDGGTTYALDPIEGGAILVNADDPADEITLSANCSASHPALGRGTWDGDDGGFRVRLPGVTLSFDGPMPLDATECGG
jgi:hypothetical protein